MNETTVEKFVGIDVPKTTLDVCIKPSQQMLHVAYDETGITQVRHHRKSRWLDIVSASKAPVKP